MGILERANSRRISPRIFACLALVVLFACKKEPPPAALPVTRNVLLITIDTLRADALSVYGNRVRTPAMEEFAKDAIVFDHAYTCAPITLPAHTSLFTGLYPPSHGVRNNGTFRAPGRLMLLAEYAKQKGYATAAVVGGFPLASQFGLNQGFDFYDDSFPQQQASPGMYLYAEKSAEEVRTGAENWIQKTNGKPFFLWLHFFDPHHPYLTHENSSIPAYQQEVLYVDRQLGIFFQFLNKNGLFKNTSIFLTSDHGEAFGEHGEISHTLFVYNTTLQIPLIVSIPGFTAGRRTAMARIIDIAPTILEVMRWKAIERVDGASLVPLLRTQITTSHENYAETLAPAIDFGWSPLSAIHDLHSKYIQAPRPEFYDLDHDPKETQNRIDTVDVQPYRRKLQKIMAQAKQAAPAYQLLPEERERLESLGYFSSPPLRPVKNPPDPKDRVEIAAKIAELTANPLPLPQKEKLYAEILKQEPGNPLLNLRYAEILLKTKDYAKAESVFQSVIKLDYPSAAAYNGLATVYYAQERMEQSEAILKRAVDLGLADGETHYNLAEFLFDHGSREEAFRQLERSIENGFLPAFFRKARLTDLLGNTEQALKILKQADQEFPEHFQVNYERGLIYFRHSSFPEAAKEYRKALEKDPNQKWILYDLGLAYFRMNDLVGARKFLRQFLESAPSQMKNERAIAAEIVAE